MPKIAVLFGCDRVTISNRLQEFGIKKRNLSEAMLGRPVTWGDKIAAKLRGKKHSEETRKKISLKTKGRVGWNKGLRKATSPKLIKQGCPGEKHWNWKGGISSLNIRIRQSSEYKNWRDLVFRKDNWTCQICKKRGGYLEADHYPFKFSTHPEKRFDINNGRTLCKACHKEVTWQPKTEKYL